MTIEISDGVTVTVNVPNRMPTICPATTPGGPITVPVQGGLTAEQLAHIVATVTANVVEELGGQPGAVSWEAVQGKPAAFPPEAHRHNAADIDDLPSGGGGAGIDDTTIGTDTTWSSQKTSDELAGKAPAGWASTLEIFGGSWEQPVDTGLTIPQGIDEAFNMAIGLSESLTDFISMQGDSVGIASKTFVAVTELPPNPTPGTVYIVPGAGGVLAFHLPIPMQ
ncbi:hypothetical protein MWT96_20740 [Prescottella equi]|uniref:hypothetical protein n=1 Tax=Rhodococcus hoagii TaxID=43767 RepID=UPI0019815B24|nr:hypothetical protein [Prescottella equi]MBM4497546.1 hypothetical protein [Prescottella equi]MBM4655596.1 hypothetical protein [Prescottella equi]MBM4718792.1 hypothetical protein [Prescottella equi]MBP0080220.1 hypothetical protein [Prescottella equi]MBP0091893.1 hypothetical protein [Prescottella equi]